MILIGINSGKGENSCHSHIFEPLFKEIYLSKALTCMNFSVSTKMLFFIKETDTFGHIVV